MTLHILAKRISAKKKFNIYVSDLFSEKLASVKVKHVEEVGILKVKVDMYQLEIKEQLSCSKCACN